MRRVTRARIGSFVAVGAFALAIASQALFGAMQNARTMGTPLRVQMTQVEYVPPEFPCTWEAFPEGGTPPYTYEWSGVLSGTDEWVTGVVEEDGDLYLTVTDANEDEAYDELYIQIHPPTPDC